MSTDRQIEANRLNALSSTGPRTLIGKARVASNILKHGLTGKLIVLPNENPRHYDAFRAGLMVSLDPHDALEGVLADKIVADAWRLRRVPILEAALHRRGRHDAAIDQAQAAIRQLRTAETSARVSAIIGIHPQQSTAREAAERKLQQAQTAKQKLFLRDRVLDATRVLETSVDAFSNLWRHERALTRSLHRTLHELQRLQAIRAGEHVPAPAVIDVNLGAASEHARDIESGLHDIESGLEDALEVNLEGDLQ